ncbi:MAG: hypothetical protein K9J13_13860 [Saprospiraceae bacterium]|nr:hypothetical protein [Saprospiraceae bacterium]
MVDTIILAVDDLEANRDLFNMLYISRTNNAKTNITTETYVEKDDSVKVMSQKVLYGSHQEFIARHTDFWQVPSSVYDIPYKVDLGRNKIVFNISVPKYLYGNSIAQFVRTQRNKKYHYGLNSDWDFTKKELHQRFIRFVELFFKREFEEPYNIKVNKSSISIERIDICYNRFFNSKNEALRYLSFQQKRLKKYETQKSDKFIQPKTGVFYTQRDYSFKIYHKGTEYDKTTKPIHYKANEKMSKSKLEKKQFFDTDYLQAQADLILRYEVTFRNGEMSRIFKQHAFRKRNLDYILLKKKYKDLYRISKSGEQPILILHPDDKRFFKLMQKSMSKRHTFKIFPDKGTEEWAVNHDNNVGINRKEAPFSKDLMNALLTRFEKLYNEFEIKTMPENEIILDNLCKQNSDVDFRKNNFKHELETGILSKKKFDKVTGKKISKNKIMMLLDQLKVHGSWDAIRELNIYPKATFYRLRKQLNDLGFENQVMDVLVPFNSKRDYEQYYFEMMINTKKLIYNRHNRTYF